MQKWCFAAVAAGLLFSSCDSGTKSSTDKVNNLSEPSSSAAPKSENVPTSQNVEHVEEDTTPYNLTSSQSNAVRSAEQYLSMSGFSRDGLIQQLSSDAGEGYSVSDATAAVDNLRA